MKLKVLVLIVVIGLIIPYAGCGNSSSSSNTSSSSKNADSIEKKFVGTWKGYDLSWFPFTDYALLSDIGGSATIKVNSDGTGSLSFNLGSMGDYTNWEYDFYTEPGTSGNTYVAFEKGTDEYIGSLGHVKSESSGKDVLSLTDTEVMITFLK